MPTFPSAAARDLHGQQLALLEMTLLAATVLRRFRLVMLPGNRSTGDRSRCPPKGALMVYAEPDTPRCEKLPIRQRTLQCSSFPRSASERPWRRSASRFFQSPL